MALRDHLSNCLSILIDQAGAIVGPTTPIAAPLLVDAERPGVAAALVRNTRLANLTGSPAITVPLATTELPAGLQLVGPTDELLLRYALAVEGVLSPPRRSSPTR